MFLSTLFYPYQEPGRRSQLWRMTTTGMLQNEAFLPPRDPRKTTPSSYADMLVLDIVEMTVHPQMHIPLVLRKADERRTTSQTWFFDVVRDGLFVEMIKAGVDIQEFR